MNIQCSILRTVAVLGLLLLLSCSKHQLTDEQYIEQAKDYKAQNQLRATIIELKNALQVNLFIRLVQAFLKAGPFEQHLHPSVDVSVSRYIVFREPCRQNNCSQVDIGQGESVAQHVLPAREILLQDLE